jgi:hypothetical protein
VRFTRIFSGQNPNVHPPTHAKSNVHPMCKTRFHPPGRSNGPQLLDTLSLYKVSSPFRGSFLFMHRVIALLIAVSILMLLTACGPSEAEKKAAWAQIDSKVDETTARLQRERLETEIEYVRLTFGPAAAKTFELCNTVKPKQKKHQAECKRLQEQVEKSLKKAPEW